MKSLRLESSDGVGSGGLQWIDHRERSGEFAVDGDAEASTGRAGVFLKSGVGGCKGAEFGHEGGAADGDAFAIDNASDSLPWDAGEFARLR